MPHLLVLKACPPNVRSRLLPVPEPIARAGPRDDGAQGYVTSRTRPDAAPHRSFDANVGGGDHQQLGGPVKTRPCPLRLGLYASSV